MNLAISLVGEPNRMTVPPRTCFKFFRQRRPVIVRLLLATLVVVMSACDAGDSGDGEIPESVAGVWVSKRVVSPEEDFTLRLNIDQDGADVQGVAEIHFLEDGESTEQFSFTGTYDPPDLDVDLDGEILDCVLRGRALMRCEAELDEDEMLTFDLTRQ